MASELRVDKIHNEGGDNDSGLDMSTNDVVAVKIAGSEKARVHSDGKVGIGETSPLGVLHVKSADSGATADSGADELVLEGSGHSGLTILSGASSTGSIYFGDSGVNYDGYIAYSQNNRNMSFGTAAGSRMTISSEGVMQTVANKATAFGLEVINDGDNSNRYGVSIKCGDDDASGTNYAVTFYDGNGTSQGNITFSSGTVSYGAFTAYHEISLPDADKANGYPYGTLLETTDIYYTQKDGSDTQRGIRYVTQKSSSQYSRKILGAYHGDMLAVADSSGTYANNLHQAAVLGDGHILCNNSGGNIKVGDGICASATAGIGQKADKLCMIIGIAQKDITFSGSETVLVPVQYGLQQFTPWTD
jgi:hypothetical protein